MTYQELGSQLGVAADKDIADLNQQIANKDTEIGNLNNTIDDKNVQLGLAIETIGKANTTILTQQNRIKELEDLLNPPPVVTQPLNVGSTLNRNTGETQAQAFTRRKTTWGVEPELVRLYETSIPNSWPVFGKAINIISFKALPQDILAGKYDAQLKSWFGQNIDPLKNAWSYWHEMEDDIEKGQFTAKQWRDAFIYLCKLADGTKGANIPRGPIAMGWSLDPKAKRTIADYFPTGARIDFMGWDSYTASEAETKTRYELIKSTTANFYPSAKILLCEVGLRDPNKFTAQQTADFVTYSTKIAHDLGFAGYVYYDALMANNLDDQGKPYDFRLNTQVEYDAISAAIKGY